MTERFEIFLVAAPGLEEPLCAEAASLGFADPRIVPGGVCLDGGWPEVWRANLELRGATRVLARFAAFRAMHLAQLDKRARKLDWPALLRPDRPVRVEATCKASRIYHAKAAAQRIETAIRETVGAPLSPGASLVVKARIDDDLCTLSLDTSGEALHRRGHKEAVGKAPLRETLAAMFLRQCGYEGTEPLVDPMCGSGTFVIEAAEIAAGLNPGRSRSFAFEHLAAFDPDRWVRMRAGTHSRLPSNPSPPHRTTPAGAPPDPSPPDPTAPTRTPPTPTPPRFHGSDRDTGAIRMSQDNAARAGIADLCHFAHGSVSDLTPPEGPPGLVMVNPPYGARIGERKLLFAVHGALGKTLLSRFVGWRVGLVTSDAGLAKATGLPFLPPGPPVAHGGLKVRLYRTEPLR